eukprot:m.835706 g.835706  ORF g.835706 m.835706 type:complete len:76 (-) comp23455_c0_seq45:295-522(-)
MHVTGSNVVALMSVRFRRIFSGTSIKSARECCSTRLQLNTAAGMLLQVKFFEGHGESMVTFEGERSVWLGVPVLV